MPRKRIIIIGATGSIGRQTREVVQAFPDQFEVVGLSSHRDETGLLAAGGDFPRAVLCLSGARPASGRIGYQGGEGLRSMLLELAADMVVNGAAGSGGLMPSLAALEAGSDLALANKESVVMGWGLLKKAAEAAKRSIVPVDSEHASLFQLVNRVGRDEVERLIITASGGAFRDRPIADLAHVSPDEAASHPNWSMGRKIAIDSATMANKGLELIEAARLFDMPADRIEVLVHPQSCVHGLVRSRDGSLYLAASAPDMRLPIQAALFWPESRPSPFGFLDLGGKSLEFRKPDPERYPILGTAYAALRAGEGSTIAYNASDEVAVAAFESGEIGFTEIAAVVAETVEAAWPRSAASLEDIERIDRDARQMAREFVQARGKGRS